MSGRYYSYSDEGDENQGISLCCLIVAKNSYVLVSVPRIHDSLDMAPKINILLTLGGLPNTPPPSGLRIPSLLLLLLGYEPFLKC